MNPPPMFITLYNDEGTFDFTWELGGDGDVQICFSSSNDSDMMSRHYRVELDKGWAHAFMSRKVVNRYRAEAREIWNRLIDMGWSTSRKNEFVSTVQNSTPLNYALIA